jgi:type IV secretion system protein VirD4
MNPDRILIGQIGIVLIEIVLTQWFATQWTAKALGYQPALGAP